MSLSEVTAGNGQHTAPEDVESQWGRMHELLAERGEDIRLQAVLTSIGEFLTEEILRRLPDVVKMPTPSTAISSEMRMLHVIINALQIKSELRKQLTNESESARFHLVGALLKAAETAERYLVPLAREFETSIPAVTNDAPVVSHSLYGNVATWERGPVLEQTTINSKLDMWSQKAGLRASNQEELRMKVMQTYWHLSQAVVNDINNVLPLEKFNMDMPDANLVGVLAIGQAALHVDLSQSSFEDCAIPVAQQAIFEEIQRKGFVRTAEKLKNTSSTPEFYSDIKVQAQKFKAAMIEVSLESEPVSEDDPLLSKCSKLERLIVLLHTKKNKSWEQIGAQLGLSAETAARIYLNVREGQRGGKYALTKVNMPTLSKKSVQTTKKIFSGFEQLPEVQQLAPKNVVINLDSRFSASTQNHSQWIRAMSEPQATRLLSIIDDLQPCLTLSETTRERAKLRSFFQNIQHPLLEDPVAFLRQLNDIVSKPAAYKADLQKWIRRPDPSSHVVVPAKFFRESELKMESLNLRKLFESHFEKNGVQPGDRALLDIGAGDGLLTMDVSDNIFDSVFAVEPDREKMLQLTTNVKMLPNWKWRATSIQAAMKQGNSTVPRSDIILFNHVLLGLQKDNVEEEIFDWLIRRRLKPGGAVFAVMNDPIPTPGSRAQLQQMHGTRPGAVTPRPPDEYAAHFLKRGMEVSVTRPELTYQASTPIGLNALKQIMRNIIPEESEDREERLHTYMRDFIGKKKDAPAQFVHRMCVLQATLPQ